MKIAVCDKALRDAEQLSEWIRQYCSLYGYFVTVDIFSSPEELSKSEGSFDIVYMCFGGSSGFMAASHLRERDRKCQIILVDDTKEFAIRSVRLHCTDFIVKPMTFQSVARSMLLAIRGEGK